MSHKPKQQAVTLRKGRIERVLLTLVFVGSLAAIAAFAWFAVREQVDDLSPLLLLFVPLLVFLLPLTVYMWRWRVVLDKDGLHRRRLFGWKHRKWSEVTKITKSLDAKANEQLWVYFAEGAPWYLFSRYEGYSAARLLLRKHRSIELREKNP